MTFLKRIIAGVSVIILMLSVPFSCRTTGKNERLMYRRDIYKKACDDDIMAGCYSLAVIEEETGEINVARRLYLRACKNRFPPACIRLQKLSKQGGGLPQQTPYYRRRWGQ